MNTLNFLIFSDLHYFAIDELDVKKYLGNSLKNIDCIITLGDISKNQLLAIELIYNLPMYGILGNHDYLNLFEKSRIIPLHGNIIEIKGVSFTGFNGSFKYKESEIYQLYTQDESIALMENIPKANILFSHDSSYMMFNEKWTHCGLIGINKYLEKCKPFFHIHGHHHINRINTLDSVNIISTYGINLLTININNLNFNLKTILIK